MFGGIGGFRLGFKRGASRKVQTVAYYDFDKYAIKSYNSIFEENHSPVDITDLSAESVPDHDIICAGFPCQAFSVAGKREGFKDTRGTLFFDIMRVARAKRTPYLFLENVKGLLNHDKGNTFKTILQSLDECGYDAQWEVLNSKNFGVPQNRERIFIVANLRGKPRPKIFPLGQSNGEVAETDEQGEVMVSNSSDREFGFKTVSPTVLSRDYKEPKIVQLNNPTHSNDRIYAEEGLSPTLNTMGGGNRQPFICASRGRGKNNEQTLEKNNEGISNSITSVEKDNLLLEGSSIRRLTPLECWRLQGFPDWAFEKARKVNSDTQLYKQAGNSLTVNVVSAIVEKWFT